MAHPVASQLVRDVALAFIIASVIGMLLILIQVMGLAGVGLLVFWLVVFVAGALFLFIA